MIALCSEHHGEADNDNWSTDQLHAMKKTPRRVDDVRGSFPSWEHENILVRLDGIYTGGSEALVAIEGHPLIRLRRNAVGLLALSFDLWDESGKLLLRMIDNGMELYPQGVHDFVAAAKKREVKLWLGDRDIGLDLTFERISMDELDEVLRHDLERSRAKCDTLLHKSMEGMDEWQRQHLQAALSGPPSVPFWIDNVSPEIRDRVREGFLTGDSTGAWVKEWAKNNCTQGDGKIPFLDFKNLSFFFAGKRMRIRNGLAYEDLEIGYCSALDNATGGINLPFPP